MPKKDRLSGKQRRLLSQMRQVDSVLKGSLAEVELTCGTPTCRCHRKGPKHKGLYFSYRHAGTSHTVYVPKALAPQARQAYGNWLRLKKVLEELTELEVGTFRDSTQSARRARKGTSR